ncbi:hypothetical protein WK66_17270 [Burkholderia ubonensis]|uniref:hypothetical protein n=1 Tax=Burkholderia ubonensis TaxID=101571 RepID=UPI00075F0FF7|nr:hypothetical protein [Burkholderia ubonensis]KVU44435.1 hypothetical protein WK66_17270 [Burkholderia ubonensis]
MAIGTSNIFGSNQPSIDDTANQLDQNSNKIANLLKQQSNQQVEDTAMNMKASLGSALKGMVDKVQL